MKKVFIPLVMLLAIAIGAGCSGKPSYYTAPDFASKTQGHKKVAVISVEMIFTGTKPKKITEAQMDSLELVESKDFQISLFNNLLKYSNTKSGMVMVEFQNYEKTNKVLEDNGIKIRDSWSADPSTLAKILDVDAVIKTRIVKERYMSDLASYGVQTATRLLNALPNGNGMGLYQVTKGGKTNDIDAQCSLLNGADGSVLWKDMKKGAADWNSPSKQIIDNITVRFSKNFPYRKKQS